MEIKNCKKCGKIFNSLGGSVCPICLQKEEDEFVLVKDYLYDNPGATIAQVSEDTGVSVEKIHRFLRDERLEIASESENMVLECERCGTPIKTGRFCEACKNSLKSEFKREFGAAQRSVETPKKVDDKMYTISRRKG